MQTYQQRFRRLIVTAIMIEAPAFILMVLALTVFDSMPIFYLGLAMFTIAAAYLGWGIVNLRRGHHAERIITPPGE